MVVGEVRLMMVVPGRVLHLVEQRLEVRCLVVLKGCQPYVGMYS